MCSPSRFSAGILDKRDYKLYDEKTPCNFYENPAIMCITFCVDAVTEDNEQIFQMFCESS